MSEAACPRCWSQDVSWRGSYYRCQDCLQWGHHDPCIYCHSSRVQYSESWAECGNCDWKGDPYDLLEEESDEE